MASVSQQVWVDIDLEEFDDDELIEELQDRGFTVTKGFGDDELIEELQDRGFTVTKGIVKDDTDLESVAWLLTLNKTEEALIQLERLLPDLRGIRDKIKSAGVV